MKTRLTFAVFACVVVAGLLLAGCSGCTSTSVGRIDLPDISADSLTYKRTDPAGGTVITVKNMVDHGTHVTADKLTVTTIYPTITLTVDVDNYRRTKPAPAPSVPASDAR